MDTPGFTSAAVAAPHKAACAAGQAILKEGGNALEAMVAVAATLAVVYPHMNGIGGDSFWVIREPSGRVRSIEACGFAGEHATIDRYRALGLDAIPVRGPQAALTVPGTIGGWQIALDMAGENGGRLPLQVILHHGISAARDGHAIGASEARYIIKEEQAKHSSLTAKSPKRVPRAGWRRWVPPCNIWRMRASMISTVAISPAKWRLIWNAPEQR
jgi:oxamate amidohydrolase